MNFYRAATKTFLYKGDHPASFRSVINIRYSSDGSYQGGSFFITKIHASSIYTSRVILVSWLRLADNTNFLRLFPANIISTAILFEIWGRGVDTVGSIEEVAEFHRQNRVKWLSIKVWPGPGRSLNVVIIKDSR